MIQWLRVRHQTKDPVSMSLDPRLVSCSLFIWLVADGWCWFVLREMYCWLAAGGWFALRGK
jgi:hypothetical protein